jgi:hypothetical protein
MDDTLPTPRNALPASMPIHADSMIYDIAADSHREVTANWDRSADGLAWAPDSRGLYGSIDDAGTSRLYHIPIDGSASRAITG